MMTHDQLRDSVFVQAQEGVLAGRRRAQAWKLRQERNKLVVSMVNQAERVNKINSLLSLLE
jgi:hypothetical protein